MQPIDYQRAAFDRPLRRRGVPLWIAQLMAFAAIVISITAFFILQSLVNAPYRPPFDMSPLLGAGDLELVRIAQAFCATVAFAAGAWLGVGAYRHRFIK